MQVQTTNRAKDRRTVLSRFLKNDNLNSPPLMKIFESELKGIYWAEKALIKATLRMIKNASSKGLIKVLENHLAETAEHASRLEEVFKSINKTVVAKKCEAMDGLIKDSDEIIRMCDEGAMCDAAIIMSAQKIEHFEIAAYGTLRQFAETLNLNEAMDLLEQTLFEEKSTDVKLNDVALSYVNEMAAATTENVNRAS